MTLLGSLRLPRGVVEKQVTVKSPPLLANWRYRRRRL